MGQPAAVPVAFRPRFAGTVRGAIGTFTPVRQCDRLCSRKEGVGLGDVPQLRDRAGFEILDRAHNAPNATYERGQRVAGDGRTSNREFA